MTASARPSSRGLPQHDASSVPRINRAGARTMPLKSSNVHGAPVQSKLHLHTASMPSSLAGLEPLPLPIPIGVPSMPSLWLSFTGATAAEESMDVKRFATSVGCWTDDGNCGARQHSADRFAEAIKRSGHRPDPIQPLSMPTDGAYQAPLNLWIMEPLVLGGSNVFSGAWLTAAARSPIVLLLIAALAQSQHIPVDWTPHLPVLILHTFLGKCLLRSRADCVHLCLSLSLLCGLTLSECGGLFVCLFTQEWITHAR